MMPTVDPAPEVTVRPSPALVWNQPSGSCGSTTVVRTPPANVGEIADPAPVGLLLKVMSVAVAPGMRTRDLTRMARLATAGTRALSVCEAATLTNALLAIGDSYCAARRDCF